MNSSSSSSSARKNTKLSVRRKPSFKKSSFSVNNLPAKKITNLTMREQTLLKKAYELSTLCEIEACLIHYSRDGELINTWPEDQSKVRDLAERFRRLSDNEKRKKCSNLSEFLNKKMNDEKKKSLEGRDDGKFSRKVLEIEASLENNLLILQDRRSRLLRHQDHQTEPDQNRNSMVSSSAFFSKESPYSLFKDPLTNFSNDQSPLAVLSDCGSEQNQKLRVSSSAFSSMDLSSSSSDPFINLPSNPLIEDQGLSHAFDNRGGFATDSLNSSQRKYSVFLYNHDNATFTQLGDSASTSFDQALTPFNNNMSCALLGAQGFVGDGSCSNNNIPTLNPFLEIGQCASWNQTASYVDPMMLSSSSYF